MKNILKQLFEYQTFERNAKLEALIAGSHLRYGEALSDDELELVAAAGELEEQSENTEIDSFLDK